MGRRGHSVSCAFFGFVCVGWRCGPCLGSLASRAVTLLLCPVSAPVTSAVAARQYDAQDLLDALSSVATVGVFSPDPRNFALVWGILFGSGVFLRLRSLSYVLYIRFLYYSPGSAGGVAF